VQGLREAGITVNPPRATFYLWVRVPPGHTSSSFATLALEEGGVVLTPGSGFGEAGEGYVRVALTVDEQRLEEAARRIRKLTIP